MKTALIWHHWYNQGGAAAETLQLYKGEDAVIASGTGTANYISFPDVDILADGSQVMAYRKGSDHNATPDGTMIFRKKTAGVWGAEIEVVASASPDWNVTDPAIGVTQTGRILLFYGKSSTAGSPSIRISYLKYSDDDGDTWSTEILFSAEQDVGGAYEGKQLNGPGRAIQYDGYMLKPMYGTPTPGSNGRLGRLYKSVDDGETWTFVANIWPASNDDGEEPCLVALASGRLIASERTDTLHETRLYYSDDAGLTWSDPVSIGFLSEAKSPLAVSPDGTLVIMGRYAPQNGRPIYSYTNDPTGIAGWSAQQEVSVRTRSFMYGGINWVTDRFHFIWAQGVLNEPTPSTSGPTLIIEKEFIPSLTAIAEPALLTEAYQAAIDYPQGLGHAVPTGALRALQNQLVQYFIDDGLWDEIDSLWIRDHGDVSFSGFSLHNWKMPFLNINALINAPTYDGIGFDFNGVDQRIDMNWVPSQNNGSYLRDSASAFQWVLENVAEIGRSFGASTASQTTQQSGPVLDPRTTSDTASFLINDNTLSTVVSTDSIGFWMIQRRSSTDKRIFKNGVEAGTFSVASVVNGATEVNEGCTNFVNGPTHFNTRKTCIIGFGSSMEGLENQLFTRLEWYRTQRALL